MLELLISMMMALGINFTVTQSGQVKISSTDYVKLESSSQFQRSDIKPSDAIIISDGVDPTAISTAKE